MPRTQAKSRRSAAPICSVDIDEAIHLIRGERVILDADLAKIYGVQTRVLKQGVRRNRHRFPADFVFELSNAETAKLQPPTVVEVADSRSQSVILKRGGNFKHPPFAFTEHGAIMAANILNSRLAVMMSVFVVRAFVKMRGVLVETRELARKLAALETELKARIDAHETAIVGVLHRVMALLDPPAAPEPPRREMGFHTGLSGRGRGSARQ